MNDRSDNSGFERYCDTDVEDILIACSGSWVNKKSEEEFHDMMKTKYLCKDVWKEKEGWKYSRQISHAAKLRQKKGEICLN